MNIIKQFSWSRLGLFIKSDLVINSSKIFTFGLTILVVLFLHGLIFIIMVPPCAWLIAYLRLCKSEI